MKTERQMRNRIIGLLDMAKFAYRTLQDEYYKGQIDAYESMLRFLMEDDK